MIVLVPFVIIVNALLGLLSIYLLSKLVGAKDCGQLITLPYFEGNDCSVQFAVMFICGCVILSAIGSIWFGLAHFFRERETY